MDIDKTTLKVKYQQDIENIGYIQTILNRVTKDDIKSFTNLFFKQIINEIYYNGQIPDYEILNILLENISDDDKVFVNILIFFNQHNRILKEEINQLHEIIGNLDSKLTYLSGSTEERLNRIEDSSMHIQGYFKSEILEIKDFIKMKD
jgi:hypothetical protein